MSRCSPSPRAIRCEVVHAAAAAGLTAIGENYAQELVGQAGRGQRRRVHARHVAVHFIGQLQTNKVRQIVDLVDVYETVDRAVAGGRARQARPRAHVLVQVNTTAEPAKGGCPPGDVAALVDQAADAGLVVDGLMTVGPTEGGAEAARPGLPRWCARCATDSGLPTCSMGMSDDFLVAVAGGIHTWCVSAACCSACVLLTRARVR